MARQPKAFTQTDVTRAIKGAINGGLPVEEAEIAPECGQRKKKPRFLRGAPGIFVCRFCLDCGQGSGRETCLTSIGRSTTAR